VSYLNTVPLVWGLASEDCDLSFAVPSECARRVEAGEADLGIVPVAEIQRHGWDWIPGTGIAAEGPVRSILLVSKVDPRRIRTLATDSGSRTSVQLARIILRGRYQCDPEFFSMDPDLDIMLRRADAALLIGDSALRLDPAAIGGHVLDLGSEWWELTRLPMVFALWAGPREVVAELGKPRLERMFTRALDAGLADLDAITAAEAAKRGFPPEVVREYLTRSIKFRIGTREKQGLAAFLGHVSKLESLVPSSIGSAC